MSRLVMLAATLALIVPSILARPHEYANDTPLEKRQATVAPTSPSTTSASASPSASPSSDPDDTGGGNMPINIFVPIVAIIGGLMLVAIFYVNRARFKPLRHRLTSHTTGFGQPGSASSGNLTSDGMVSASSLNVSTPRPRPGPPARGGRADRGRNVRRTESGRSVRTLPPYSKEAGDEEMVLVRQQSLASTWDGDMSDDDGEGEGEGEVEVTGGEMTERSLHATVDRAGSQRRAGDTASPPDEDGGAITTDDARQDEADSGTSRRASEGTSPRSAPVDGQPARTGSIGRRGWGEAPTYLEAMSSPDFHDERDGRDLEAGLPPPRTPTAAVGAGGAASFRERTATSFRDFLSRTGFAPQPDRSVSTRRPSSQASLLLQPQSSRLSGMSTTSGQFQGQGTGGTGTSPYPSPWASSHSLVISSPLPHSAVRASFDSARLPRGGITEQQMRFLSSTEALHTAGVSLADPPPGRRRARSEARSLLETSEVAPPSWEELDEQRRRHEAEQRRDLARPVGTTRSMSGNGNNDEGPAAGAEAENSERGQGSMNTGAGDGDATPRPSSVEETAAAATEARGEASPTSPTSTAPATGSSLSTLAPSLAVVPPSPISPEHNRNQAQIHAATSVGAV
ncbi:hypothetical protein EHS25_010279 [Saitozyma podzolica]|uniref:Uncharacterized protein n=1 Tax=Saitozyma podzolica TaxID=1890683 RepID=A0A427YJ62_9TREE|nr:hypothetical protein EHS25_010279 [Saitozyma podzolica]